MLRVVPNRLQFFEFDSISFDCDGFDDFTEWRVMKRIMGVTSRCGRGRNTSRTPCSLEHVLEGDSGVYWCEANETAISNSVHITVTGRLRIVTLKNKQTSILKKSKKQCDGG